MKKNKIIASLFVLSCGMMFASCGNQATSTNLPQESITITGDAIPEEAYKVKVVYPDGTPATTVNVQWCATDSGTCYKLVSVDDNGVGYTTENAIITSSRNFNVHILNLPAGYGYNPYELVQNSNNKDNVMTLIKLNSEDRLDGSETSPSEVKVGYDSIKIAKDESGYIYFKPTEAGSYTIESYSPSPSNLEIYFAGNDLSNIKPTNDFSKNGGNENNFKYTFTVAEDKINTPFVFIMLEKGGTSTFTFSISKN